VNLEHVEHELLQAVDFNDVEHLVVLLRSFGLAGVTDFLCLSKDDFIPKNIDEKGEEEW
jgi:hypothetical protein